MTTQAWEDAESDPCAQLRIVTASDVEIRRVVFHWEGRIPIGATTIMPGEEGIGKTTVGIRIIGDTTRGTLPGEHYGTPRDVVVIAPEDGIEDVFTPRLREAGADLCRVHFVKARVAPADGTDHEVIIPRDLEVLGHAVRRYNAAMIWIDSLVTTLPDDFKSIAYKDVAKVLKSLNSWAAANSVAVVAPWHLNKATGSDTALRIMDSRAFRTAVRSMLLVVADPDAPRGTTAGIVALDKLNAGPLSVPALRYTITTARYLVNETDPETGELCTKEASCGVAAWTGAVDGNGRDIARQALAPRIEPENSPLAWLRRFLTEEGETARTVVIDEAKKQGFSEDQMKRAASKLHVHSTQQTGHDKKTGRPWRIAIWSLPSQSGGPDHYTP